MTKAQQTAYTAILDFIDGQESELQPKTLAWKTIVATVRAKHRVKNWMTIRGVLQFFKNEGLLNRTSDLHVEEYTATALNQ
tara:strand:+ start:247 stop:489 length:243 start_codon:yes stop_codon:yes gene_type:complete